MRGIVFTGNRNLEILTFDDPTPGPGEAVIRMQASGMCGSDLHFYRAENPNAFVASLGFKSFSERGMDPDTRIIAGHEPCGIVVAVGPGVDPATFKVGDRVIVFHYEGCNCCDPCRTGWTQMCDQGAVVHGIIGHGGHAEYQKVPVSSLVVALPLNPAHGALGSVCCP